MKGACLSTCLSQDNRVQNLMFDHHLYSVGHSWITPMSRGLAHFLIISPEKRSQKGGRQQRDLDIDPHQIEIAGCSWIILAIVSCV